MPLPHLHILHPLESRLPGITAWLAGTQSVLQGIAEWDGCKIHCRPYDEKAAFSVATETALIRAKPGPVILIQKVQASLCEKLEKTVERKAKVYTISVCCEEDLWQACEEAKKGHEDGEPRIPMREVVAYLIVKKLDRLGRYGGIHGYLWDYDLPRGGFPKDGIGPRLIFDVTEALVRAKLLEAKAKDGKRKFGIENAAVAKEIVRTKMFDSLPEIKKFFRRDTVLVTARLLDYNDETIEAAVA